MVNEFNSIDQSQNVIFLSITINHVINFTPLQTREIRTGLWSRTLHKLARTFSLLVVSKRLGTRLIGTYFLIKLFYLANAIGQIYMMQSFLGLNDKKYKLFGATILNDILIGKDWQVTLIFPRVGYCVVPVKHMGTVNHVTAQCILPVNMLNERIYVFLWFWVVLIATITAISIPTWFLRMSYQKSRTLFVKKYLKLGEMLTKKDSRMVDKFTRQFLRHDGIFLLRMISMNAGELICSDIVCALWKIFKTKYYNRDFNYPFDFDSDDQHQHEGMFPLHQGMIRFGGGPTAAEQTDTSRRPLSDPPVPTPSAPKQPLSKQDLHDSDLTPATDSEDVAGDGEKKTSGGGTDRKRVDQV